MPGAVLTCREGGGALTLKAGDEGRRAKERFRVPLAYMALATRMSRCLGGNSSIKMGSSGWNLPRTGNWKPPARCLRNFQPFRTQREMIEIRKYDLGERAVGAIASGILCVVFSYCSPSGISYCLLTFLACLSCSKEKQG